MGCGERLDRDDVAMPRMGDDPVVPNAGETTTAPPVKAGPCCFI
jgi:hypothetical protein